MKKIITIKSYQNSIGVSFIEVLVSIVLLGVVASFVALSIPTTVGLSTRTDKMEATTAIAQKYIEEVKATYKKTPTLYNSLEDGATPPITITTEHTSDGKYDITTDLTIDNTTVISDGISGDDPVPCLATLTVTVVPVVNGVPQTGSDQAVTTSSVLRRDR